MSNSDRFRKQAIASELEEPVDEARNLAEKLGLEPYPVKYWIIDYDEMNELIAYGGFQSRYPHWRWGMQYDKQQKQGQYAGGKAFEIVNNDNPAHAFLQESNTVADQKAVITHVEAHSDFFANNDWFGMFTSGRADEDQVNAAAMLERHARAIDEYMSDPEIDRAEVEKWIDHCLSLEDNIDQHQVFSRRLDVDGPAIEGIDEDLAEKLDELELSDEIKGEVFTEEWVEQLEEEELTGTFPEEPQKDLLAFVREHGKQYDDDAGRGVEMEEWQRDILDMMRAEAYYFAAQKMTKVMNEGWACVDPKTPIFTTDGLVPMREVVDNHTTVSDGETTRNVYDANIIPDHDTVTIETRRGFELTGSNNHRIRLPDGSWSRLDELSVGDEIDVSGGNDTWSSTYADLEWEPPENVTLNDVAEEAGVSVWTVMRYRRVGRARKAEAIENALSEYEGDDQGLAHRDPIAVPDAIDERFGRFLGLLVGDGHVSSSAGHVGFTNGEKRHAEEFAGLVDELFGIEPTVEQQGNRWRVYAYSRNLVELLQEEIGLPDGKAADRKTVPEPILRSPRSVVAEFIRGLFDADGHAGDQGAILTTTSEELSETVLLLLTNFDILGRRREQTDGCYHVHLTGKSAHTFADEIGFGYPEKADALRAYLDDLSWFQAEEWTDEIVSIAESTGTVYDISVEETHRYAGAGVINHNSYWESTMMTDEAFAGDDEFLNYADHMAKVLASGGLNPYSLGMELWEYVENTTNRREVLEALLRVEGISWRNLVDVVDFDDVLERLEPPAAIETITPETLDALGEVSDEWVDHEAVEKARAGEINVSNYPWKVLTETGLARRHYSLVKRQHRGFLGRVNQNELERIGRYLFDDARYASIEEALDDVDFTAGWNRMFDVRESHNDVTFLDEFLTQEFITENNYFTYEHSQATGQFHVASDAAEDVKKKLLLQFTNFGKPTIAVYDGNYNNANELLLGHQYNGVMLDLEQATETLKRIFELWGRPVNLLTIVKEVDEHDIEVAKRRNREPEPEEQGKLIRYNGQTVTTEDVPWEEVEHLAADDVDYDTKPDEWLA
ncbi:SpoVR family protein [Natrinema altunense]|uniref:SpoVR family protein n=1 Tax=Natrinema altunense TaxID=222984 RepID=A0A482XVG7_9EURY|nr:SpoVR family protein [Natrinema altunense]RZH67449.1 SpoVR family protein [Natrinema altunense]